MSPGTTYSFKVGACNAVGTTWANSQTARTPALGPPAAPSFMALMASSSSVELLWSGVSGATSYLVDEWIKMLWKQVGSTGSGGTSYVVNGLVPGSAYSFQVAASNAFGTTWANSQIAWVVDHPAAATYYSPVSGSLFGANGPSYLDVHQGAEGDCWLMASLAAAAARYPSDIQNMFTDLGSTSENGFQVELYKVRFFNSARVPTYVVVDTELPSGGSYYDNATSGILWVALAEKAYAQAHGAGYVTAGMRAATLTTP